MYICVFNTHTEYVYNYNINTKDTNSLVIIVSSEVYCVLRNCYCVVSNSTVCVCAYTIATADCTSHVISRLHIRQIGCRMCLPRIVNKYEKFIYSSKNRNLNKLKYCYQFFTVIIPF